MFSSRPNNLEFSLIPKTLIYLMCHLLLATNSFYIVFLHKRSICFHQRTVKLLCVACVSVFFKTENVTFNRQGNQILWLADCDEFNSSACIPKGKKISVIYFKFQIYTSQSVLKSRNTMILYVDMKIQAFQLQHLFFIMK